MTNKIIKQVLLCIVFISFSSYTFSQSGFGAVRKKPGGDLDSTHVYSTHHKECIDFENLTSYSFEFYLQPENFSNCTDLHFGTTINGTTFYQPILPSDYSQDPVLPNFVSVDIDPSQIDQIECNEGDEYVTYEMNITIYCLSEEGTYEFVTLGGIQDFDFGHGNIPQKTLGLTRLLKICCEQTTPPTDDVDYGRILSKDKILESNIVRQTEKDPKITRTPIQITIWPNSNESLESDLRIYNINGKAMQATKEVTDEHISFEISNLPSGYYILSGIIDGKQYAKPFVKI